MTGSWKYTTALAAVAGLAGCGLDTPDRPTYAGDVKPILAANCVRCHGYPAIGGAPDSFRLDMYDDFVAPDGQIIRGARTMAEFIATRVDSDAASDSGFERMPPEFPISDRQARILMDWYAQRPDFGVAERGGEPAGNRTPTMELTWPLADSLAEGALVIQYQILDPDRELVSGELRYGDSFDAGVRIGPLHAGRGEVIWDVGAEEAGEYRLWARLDDGGATHDIEIASYDNALQDGNRAPRVTVIEPVPYQIMADRDSPFAIVVDVDDPDATDSLTLTVEAVREQERVVVADGVAAVAGTNSIPWDTSGVTEGGGWRLQVTASDGRVTRSVRDLPFRISHRTSSLTYADISDIFGFRCVICHPQGIEPRIPDLRHNFDEYDDVGDVRGVYSLRGLIYRRVVELRNMPPPSDLAFNAPMTDAERAMLAEWLLAGAPPAP